MIGDQETPEMTLSQLGFSQPSEEVTLEAPLVGDISFIELYVNGSGSWACDEIIIVKGR